MKKLKSGFTLAEVLITIAVIGIIATMVLPSVMTNHTYKTMGTKLTKFIAQIEDSARPFVVMNDSFDTEDDSIRGLQEYLEDTFVVTNEKNLTGDYFIEEKPEDDLYETLKNTNTGDTADENTPALQLKDGTALVAIAEVTEANTKDTEDIIDEDKVGDPIFTLRFSPNISGVPKSARQSFYFVVTNLGYVFPDQSDACTLHLYKKGFNALASDFKSENPCHVDFKDTESKD